MKEKILKKTSEIFTKFGFKSVTMDDIASELAVSKKTIYKYFTNKEDLIDQAVSYAHQDCINEVNNICSIGYNAIQENFEIKKIFKDLNNNMDSSPMFQLKKYYPKTFERIISEEFSVFKDCILRNLENGIKDGLYRKDINASVVTRFYFTVVMSVYDENLFTYSKNTINKLEIDVLEYHTRAIATKEGIRILEQQLAELNNN